MSQVIINTKPIGTQNNEELWLVDTELIPDWLIGMTSVSTAQILRWTGSTLLSIVCIQQSRSPCCHQNSVSMIRQ